MDQNINAVKAEYKQTVSKYAAQFEAIKETRNQVRQETGTDPLIEFIRELARLIREKFFTDKADEELPKFWRIIFGIGEMAGMLITLIRAIFLL